MSDSESKKYEKARKTFFSRVSERTRSKRDTYREITHSHSHSHRTCSSSQNAVHGSGGISRNEHKRKLWGYSSSCNNNIDKSGLAASQENAREHKRRRLVKPAASVGARINHSGKKRDDVIKKEPMIEIINESEFRNKNICSASGIRRSTMQGLNKGFYAASSWKKVNISSKKPFAFVEIPSEYASHRRLLHQEGNDNEDSDSEEIEIIDKDEFMSQNSCSMSKVGPSSKEKLKASFSAATTRKNASNVITESSAGYCESFCPDKEDHASRPFIQIGSDTDDMIPEDKGIKGIDEAEFRNQKKHFESNIRRSAEQARCAACSCKNVDGAKKNVSSADHSVIFRHKECCTGPDMLADNSSTLAKKVNNNEPMSCRKTTIKREDEGELKNGKSSTNSKRGAFTRQGYSAVSSKKNADIVKELSIDSYGGSFSEDAGRDSHKEQANRSRAFTETVNSDEDTDPEELGIEEVDESEFRKRRQIVSEIGSSTRQERNEGHFASTSAKNVNRVSKKIPSTEKIDKNKRKRKVSSYSESKKKGEVGHDEVDDSTSEFTDSHSSSESNSDDVTTSLQDDEVSSCGANSGMGLGVASRTRSKMGSIRKPTEVGSLSIDSDSSPTDSGYHSINCEDFKVESSDDGIELLACDVQNNKLVEVSVEKDVDCNKQGSCAVENASEPSHKSFQSKESNCEQPVLESQKFSSGKRQLSDDASSKPAAEGKALKICEFQVQNEERDQTFRDVAEAEEGLKERNNGCDEELHPVDQSQEGVRRPKKAAKEGKSHKNCEVQDDNQKGCDEVNRVTELHPNDQTQTRMWRPKKAAAEAHKKCRGQEEKKEMGQTFSLKETNISQKSGSSKESFTKKGCDGVNELHLKEQSQAGMRRAEKEDLPSHSKIDCDQSDDGEEEDTREKTEAASSVPTGRDQMSSEHYDLCSMLADVVLGKGQMTENDIIKGDEENHGECKQAPASQTQDTLPLKFRFEDEVPEPVEKTDYEKEIDGLFSELDCNWALEELRAFDHPEVNLENENSPAEETQHERCSRGKHELVLEDDEGLICIFCRHVVLEPKDVLPEWVERTYQDSARRRNSETERSLEFDELHLQSSIDNVSDCNATGTVWSIKAGVRESMYEHQQEGFEFLWKNLAGSINLDELKSTNPGGVGGCIISHAPGTGKTRLTIVFVETYLKMFPNCRPVIISPASMLLTWEEEFRKWNVGYPFLNLNNSELAGKEKNAVGHLAPAKSRDMESIRMIKIFSWSRGGSILGISYSLFEKLIGEKHIKGKSSKKRERLDQKNTKIRQILLEMPGLVVLDEGHTPRNQRSNIWNALLKLKTQKRVILSGTPFQNNFGELFNTLRIVRPSIADVLVQEKTYADMVATRRTGRKHKGGHSQSLLISEVVDRAVENLKLCMSPFVHLHKGTILQQSLPGLRDCVVVLKPPTLQKSLIERIQGSSNFKFEHEVALISVHPYLFLHCESKEDQMTGIDMDAVGACKLNPQEGVKTRFILELVRLSMAVKEKVLVFSQYIQPLELIKEQLEEIFKWVDGKQILRMKGKLEQKQRQILINLFNDPMSESKIMLASTRCCSEGISLIGASRVVLLDVVWNPSVERQAISRAYRIGQKKFVYTYHLMTSGTTESDKYCRQTEKERLSELVFSSGNEQKHLRPLGMEDRILEVMVAHQSLKGMFEKIINQPKDTDLIQTFGLTS